MIDGERLLEQPPCPTEEEAPTYLRVFLNAEAEAAIERHVEADVTHEVCGILLGRRGRDKHGWFVHVVQSIEGRFAQQRGASVTFTHETWDHFYQVMAGQKDNLAIVGWYHSHPGFGIFYSSHDSFIQQNFFSEPWQIGIVVDPCASSRGVFANSKAGIEGVLAYWRVNSHGGARVECQYRDRVATRDPEPSAASSDTNQLTIVAAAIAALRGRADDLDRRMRRLRLANTLIGAAAILALAIALWLWFAGRMAATHEPSVDPAIGKRELKRPRNDHVPEAPGIDETIGTKAADDE